MNELFRFEKLIVEVFGKVGYEHVVAELGDFGLEIAAFEVEYAVVYGVAVGFGNQMACHLDEVGESRYCAAYDEVVLSALLFGARLTRFDVCEPELRGYAFDNFDFFTY